MYTRYTLVTFLIGDDNKKSRLADHSCGLNLWNRASGAIEGFTE